MANDKKKIQIDIEGDASSLEKAAQKSQGLIAGIKAQVALLIVQLQGAVPAFFSVGQAAVSTMTSAAASVTGLLVNAVGLGVQLARLTANYLGLSIGIDTNSAKMEIGRKALEKFHLETRISLGFLKQFADFLRNLPFPTERLAKFVDMLAKMDIVLGIGRGKKIDLFESIQAGSEKAATAINNVKKAVDVYADHVKSRLGALVGVLSIETLINWKGIKFEAAFSEVRKVVEGTQAQMRQLKKELLDMSTGVSTPVEALTAIAAIGGQMGLPSTILKSFVDLVSKIGVAFGMLPEQAAEAVGKIRAIYNLGIDEIKQFADQVNYIADNAKGAVSESGLLAVVNYVGETAKGFGLLRSELLGLSGALLQTGKEPEKVGTAIRNLLTSLQTAPEGTKPFQEALQQMGYTAQGVADAVARDPKKALDDFLLTLKKFDNQSQASLLSKMFGRGEDTEIIKTLVSSVEEYQRLSQLALSPAAIGSMDRTFIEKEKTALAALDRLKNSFYALAIVSADIFLPAINGVANAIGGLVRWLKELNESYPNTFAFMRIAAVFGILGTVIKFVFGEATIAVIRGFFTGLIGYFSGGFAGGLRAVLMSVPALFAAVFQTAVGRAVGAATVIFGAFQVLPPIIGAVSTAIGFLATNPVALLGAAFIAVIAKMTLSATVFAGLRGSVALLGRGLLTFLGGPVGLAISAITFLIIKFYDWRDELVKLGNTNATVTEILNVVWKRLTDNLGKQIDWLKSKYDELVGKNDEALTKIETKTAETTGKTDHYLKDAYNTFQRFFSGIYAYADYYMTLLAGTIEGKMVHFSKLAAALKEDLAAAGRGDFSFSNASYERAVNDAQEGEFKRTQKNKLEKTLSDINQTDFVGLILSDLEEGVIQQRGTPTPAPPPESRQTNTGAPLPDLQANGDGTEKAKAHIRQLDDLQQQAHKNQLDRLNEARDYELAELAVVFRDRALIIKKTGLAEAEEKAKLIALAKEQADQEIAIKANYLLKAEKLNDQAIQQRIKAARAEIAATSAPSSGSLAALIAGGESKGYNDYNKGTRNGKIIPSDKPVDLTSMTLGEIQARQALSITNTDRLGAVGKYQVIASTLKEAIAALKLSADAQYDAATQEKIFAWLVGQKRPALQNHITGATNDSQAAQLAAAMEFRSVADPRTGLTFADKGQAANKATVSSAEFQPVLAKTRTAYQQNVAAGMDKSQAFSQAVAGSGASADNQAELVDKLAALNQERIANRQDTLAQLKQLGLDEKTAQQEQSESTLELAKQQTEREKAILEERQQAAHDAALDAVALKEEAANTELALGNITETEHLTQLRGFADERLEIEQTLLNEKRELYKQDELALQKNINEKQRLEREAALKKQQQLTEDAKNQQAIFEGMMGPFKNAMSQMTNGVLTGQQTITNAVRNAANSVLVTYASTFIQERAMQAAQWAWKLSGIALTQDQEKALKNGDVIWAVMLFAKEKAMLAGKWAFDLTGTAKTETGKKAIKSSSFVWDSILWAREKIGMVGHWAFELVGFGVKEAKKKAIKTAAALWDGMQWVAKKAQLAGQWLFEVLGFTTKEAVKTTAVATGAAIQTGAEVTKDVVTTASHVAATETKDKVTLMSTLKSIFLAAKAAAAFTYQSVSAIPFIGWAIAPAAAVVAFAAVMAMGVVGSAKKGEWEVSEDGKPYMLHEKESVLPAWAADNWRKMVSKADQLADPSQLIDRAGAKMHSVISGNPMLPPGLLAAIDGQIAAGQLPKLLPPAPPGIMESMGQQRRMADEVGRQAQQQQAETVAQTAALMANRRDEVRHAYELRVLTIDANEIIRAGRSAIVQVLHEEHRKFNTVKK